MAHSKRAHSNFIPIHIRVPYIQYTSVFHNACAGRKCGQCFYFFFLPPFFSFFSFLGLSSCLPWGLYLADQAEKDSNSSCILQHTPTPSDHRPTPSAISSPCNGAHKEARPYCHTNKTRVPRQAHVHKRTEPRKTMKPLPQAHPPQVGLIDNRLGGRTKGDTVGGMETLKTGSILARWGMNSACVRGLMGSRCLRRSVSTFLHAASIEPAE